MQFKFEEQLVSAGDSSGTGDNAALQQLEADLLSAREQLTTSEEMREHLEQRNETLADQLERLQAVEPAQPAEDSGEMQRTRTIPCSLCRFLHSRLLLFTYRIFRSMRRPPPPLSPFLPRNTDPYPINR